RNAVPYRPPGFAAAAGPARGQGMPGRGLAAAGRRRDLLRRTTRNRQGPLRMSTVIERYADTDTLVAAAGDRLGQASLAAITARGQATIVLTGGGTGIGLLKRVGERGTEIDWSKVHVYWGDERFVPQDDDERNDKQAREALLDHVGIPDVNVHAMAA